MRKRPQTEPPGTTRSPQRVAAVAVAASLTWAGRLDLGLTLFGVGVEEVRGRVLAALDLALEGVQTLDVLLLERAGCAAGRAHVQVGGQLPPLFVLVDLVGDTGEDGGGDSGSVNATASGGTVL